MASSNCLVLGHVPKTSFVNVLSRVSIMTVGILLGALTISFFHNSIVVINVT